MTSGRPQYMTGYQEAPGFYQPGGYGQEMLVAAPDDPIFVVYEYEGSSTTGATTMEP